MRHRLRDGDPDHRGQAVAREAEAVAQADAQREIAAQKTAQKEQCHQQRRKRRTESRPRHAESCAGQEHAQPENRRFTRLINQKKIENGVEDIEGDVEEHRRACVAHAAQERRHQVDCHQERHRAADDQKISRGVGPDGLLRAKQAGQRKRERRRRASHEHAEQETEQHGFTHNASRALCLPCPDVLGHLNGKARGRRPEQAIEKPHGAGDNADRGRRVRPQRADHRRVNVLHQREHKLLHNRGPRQSEHRGNFLPPRRCAALLQQCRKRYHENASCANERGKGGRRPPLQFPCGPFFKKGPAKKQIVSDMDLFENGENTEFFSRGGFLSRP